MSGLLKKYLESTIDSVINARNQSDGKVQSNYFDGVERGPGNTLDDVYQSEFKARAPGTKYFPLSSGEDTTEGRWLTKGLLYYGDMVDNSFYSTHRNRLVHKYNQRKLSSHYTEQCSDTLGVKNVAKDNEIL